MIRRNKKITLNEEQLIRDFELNHPFLARRVNDIYSIISGIKRKFCNTSMTWTIDKIIPSNNSIIIMFNTNEQGQISRRIVVKSTVFDTKGKRETEFSTILSTLDIDPEIHFIVQPIVFISVSETSIPDVYDDTRKMNRVSETEQLFVNVVMDRKQGELLSIINIIGKNDESLKIRQIQHLLNTVLFLHENGLYHNDLKCENILYDEQYNLFISDFDCSVVEPSKSQCTTRDFLPPEGDILITNATTLESKKILCEAIDYWQIGLVILSIIYNTVTTTFYDPEQPHEQHVIPYTEYEYINREEEPTMIVLPENIDEWSRVCGVDLRYLFELDPYQRRIYTLNM